MSKSNKTLEKVLEYILAEEEGKAAELIHEYVVDCARTKYQSILDEDIDQYNDIEKEITDDEDEIEADNLGEIEDEDDAEFTEFSDEDEDIEDDLESDGIEHDLDDKFDNLEADLEELRAEFNKIVGNIDDDDSEFDADDDSEFDIDDEDESEFDDSEFDTDDDSEFDADADADEDELNEATAFAKKASQQHVTGGMKGSEDDSNNNKLSVPRQKAINNGSKPVIGRDGSNGNSRSLEKDGQTNKTNHNIKVNHRPSKIQHRKTSKKEF